MVGDLEGSAIDPGSPTSGHTESGGQHQVWLEDLGLDAMRWRLDDFGRAGRARAAHCASAKGDESPLGATVFQ
jgi:hypothetical protein